jgi:hypothetical protein
VHATPGMDDHGARIAATAILGPSEAAADGSSRHGVDDQLVNLAALVLVLLSVAPFGRPLQRQRVVQLLPVTGTEEL